VLASYDKKRKSRGAENGSGNCKEIRIKIVNHDHYWIVSSNGMKRRFFYQVVLIHY